jgi:cell division control protein 6
MSEPNIFDKVPSPARQCIIVDAKYLDTRFVPDELPHREEQIKDLVGLITPVLKGQSIQPITVYGPPGTGKSAAITYIGREFERKVASTGKNIPWTNINCYENTSEYSIIRRFCSELEHLNKSAVVPPATGYSMPQMYVALEKNLGNFKTAVLVLDEIDQIFSKKMDGNSVLYRLSGLPVHVIAITNDPSWKEFLEPRVKSRINFSNSRIFQSYNAKELADILSQRADHAFRPDSVDSGAMKYCAALAAQKGGDARIAIDLLRFAAQEADRNGANKILEAHVKSAVDCLEASMAAQAIDLLDMTQSVLLLAVMDAPPYQNYGAARTGDVYEVYKNICWQNKISPLTQRSVITHLNVLDRYHLISMHVKSFGRGGGRTSLIRPTIAHKTAIEGLENKIHEFPELRNIINRATGCSDGF